MQTIKITVDEYLDENTGFGFFDGKPRHWQANLMSKPYRAANWLGDTLGAESIRLDGKANTKVEVANSRFIHRYLKAISHSSKVNGTESEYCDMNYRACFEYDVVGEEPEQDKTFDSRLKVINDLFKEKSIKIPLPEIFVYRENAPEWSRGFADRLRSHYAVLCEMGLTFTVVDDDGFRQLQTDSEKRSRTLAVLSLPTVFGDGRNPMLRRGVLPRIVFGRNDGLDDCIFIPEAQGCVDYWNISDDNFLEETLTLYAEYYLLKPMFMDLRSHLLRKPWSFEETRDIICSGLRDRAILLDGSQNRSVVMGQSMEYRFAYCNPIGALDNEEETNVKVQPLTNNIHALLNDSFVSVAASAKLQPDGGEFEFSSKLPLFVWRGADGLEKCDESNSPDHRYSCKVMLSVEGNGLCYGFKLTGSTRKCAVGDALSFSVDAHYWLGYDGKIKEELEWYCNDKPVSESNLSKNGTVLKMTATEPGELRIAVRTSKSHLVVNFLVNVLAHANWIKLNINKLDGDDSIFCILDSDAKSDIVTIRCEAFTVLSLTATAVNNEHKEIWDSKCDFEGKGNGVLVKAGEYGSLELTVKATDPAVSLERKVIIKSVTDPGTIWCGILLATMLVGFMAHYLCYGLSNWQMGLYVLTPFVIIHQLGNPKELLRTLVQRSIAIAGGLFTVANLLLSFIEEML